ncbi:hypothetical protein DNHGIG_22550 [Collibacillus ludicampi]|uniref:Uncharacterized protein n=1 Tax=Collibacillus ludicampi TaxID=2771369 RepID=A0AAV4LG32_9BACL|nr:YiiX/YebB-like N1pC/P60 family cysteine hydrolase [Collibacillus ludicampi]GIM46706.1 hypothetical protein DNHGIG_22550 [Collibacillus ludicampi]
MKKKKALLKAFTVPIFVSAFSFTSLASANQSDTNVQITQEQKDEWKKNHNIPKTPLPQDPRGPIPNFQSLAEYEQWAKTHPDISVKSQINTVSAQSQKKFPMSSLSDGDLVFGAKPYDLSSGSSIPYGYFRHAGMYVNDRGKFISAMPGKGVRWETVDWWETNYADVSLNWVPSTTSSQRTSVVQNASYHIGEPYDWGTNKYKTNKWYCSKLPWFEYNKWAQIDLDSNGGYWVTPDDIYNSNYVKQYWRG